MRHSRIPIFKKVPPASWHGRINEIAAVNVPIGFEQLAEELHKPSKSLHRMLAPRGNPSMDHFFGIMQALQKSMRVKLRVATLKQ